MHLLRLVMDPQHNPLWRLAPAQAFQIMLGLSVMWTIIFSAALGLWLFYAHLVLGHVLVLGGILVTSMVFRKASRVQTYRDHPLPDGTARYDDVWGA
jgi:hypothetical protein